MTIVNHGDTSIGRQIINGDGGPQITNIGRTTIEEQVCLSGVARTTGHTTIKVRYIPPGSTCVIEDGPNVKVLKPVHRHPPKIDTITVDGIGVQMTGSGVDTMSSSQTVNFFF